MKYKLVMIDDEKNILKRLEKIIPFTELSLSLVKSFTSSTKALSYLEENPVDLIICDIKMPLLSGLELLGKVKEINKLCSFIFISGYDKFAYVQEAIRLTAVDYILKPIQRDQLIQAIKKSLERLDVLRLLQSMAKSEKKSLNQYSSPQVKEKLQLNNDQNEAILIDFPPNSIQEEDWELWTFTIINVLKELISPQKIDFYLEEKPKIFALSHSQSLERQIEKTIQFFDEQISIQLRFFLASSYSQLLQIWQNKIHFPLRQIIFFQDLTSLNKTSTKAEVLLQHFALSAKLLNWNTCKEIVQELIGVFEAERLEANLIDIYLGKICLLIHESSSKKISSQDFSDWNELRAMLLAAIDSSISQTAKLLELSPSHLVIEQVINYIYANYFDPELSLKKLSDLHYISPNHLSTIFKENVKITITSFITEVRINLAEKILSQSKIKINDLARQVGFNDPKYFSRCFKKLKGYLPSKFN